MIRRVLLLAVRLAVTAAALALALRLVEGVGALELPHRPAPGWAALAVAGYAAVILVLAARLRMVLGPGLGAGGLVSLTWRAQGLGQVALGTLGGDAYRSFVLTRGGRALGWVLGRVLLDRAIGLMGLLLLGALALAWVTGAPAMLGLFGLPLAVGVGLAALARRRGEALPAPLRPVGLALAGQPAARLWRRGAATLGLAVLGHLLSVLQFYAIARALGLLPPPVELAAAASAGLLGAALPLSLGGWGVRELSFAAMLGGLGVTMPEAVLVSVLYGLVQLACGAPAAILAALHIWWPNRRRT